MDKASRKHKYSEGRRAKSEEVCFTRLPLKLLVHSYLLPDYSIKRAVIIFEAAPLFYIAAFGCKLFPLRSSLFSAFKRPLRFKIIREKPPQIIGGGLLIYIAATGCILCALYSALCTAKGIVPKDGCLWPPVYCF